MDKNDITVRIDQDSYLKAQESLAHVTGLLSGLRMSMDDFEDDQDLVKTAIVRLTEVQDILREGLRTRHTRQKKEIEE